MPQMAPISWLTLFFLFSFAFIIFNIMNYYCFNNQPFSLENKNDNNNNESEINNNPNNSMSWKW